MSEKSMESEENGKRRNVEREGNEVNEVNEGNG